MSLVAEQMNYFEAKEKSEGMLTKVVKYGFSIMFMLSALVYVFDLDKITKSGKTKQRRRWKSVFAINFLDWF